MKCPWTKCPSINVPSCTTTCLRVCVQFSAICSFQLNHAASAVLPTRRYYSVPVHQKLLFLYQKNK
jgi:hypothetical protein